MQIRIHFASIRKLHRLLPSPSLANETISSFRQRYLNSTDSKGASQKDDYLDKHLGNVW